MSNTQQSTKIAQIKAQLQRDLEYKQAVRASKDSQVIKFDDPTLIAATSHLWQF